MKKFEKEVKWNENEIVKFIDGMIEVRAGGDWNDYEVGDEVRYDFDLEDDGYLEDLKEEFGIELSDIKELVGEGICLVVDEDIWYNVYFENDILVVKYIVLEYL
jgi:hypothetical protein